MSQAVLPTPAAAPASEPKTDLLAMLRSMYRIRWTEETIADMVERGEVGCPAHLYSGQEAVATGVCAALGTRDYVFSGHRSHGPYLAKGGDLNAMMAEILGRSNGCARGRGGSMHLVDPEVSIPGTVPIVAATIPIAVGAALAGKLRNDGTVSVSFFGDGATEEGTFHESMNLAACHKLPVLFVCENNLYAAHMVLLQRRAKDNIVLSARAHGMPGHRVDGNDVQAVYRAAKRAVTRARQGRGPTLIECRTYRLRGHVGPNLDLHVSRNRGQELVEWREKDPIFRLRNVLLSEGTAPSELDAIEQQVRHEVEQAVAFARRSPLPDPSEVSRYVYSSAAEVGSCE